MKDRKKLVIFLFLSLLHILSCHPLMSHATQVQSSLLLKQNKTKTKKPTSFCISTEVMFP